MLKERNNILQKYAENTKESGEMYYIYNTNTNENNSYNLCICKPDKSQEVITKKNRRATKRSRTRKCFKKTT